MAMSIYFFATASDVKAVLETAEARTNLQFVRAGRSAMNPPLRYERSADIPNLGIAAGASSVLCDRYLVSAAGLRINARVLTSDPPFAIDQLVNPKTVTLNAGGLWKNNILLRGSIGTASKDSDSWGLMKMFRPIFKNAFTNVKGMFVGPEAFELWRNGARLTGAEQSPPEFDLAL